MAGAPADLIACSARIGAQPLLVQGPGGNTSIKAGDVLWVKASGRWLSECAERPIFVPLSLPGVRERLARDFDADLSPEVLAGAEPGLRPSIETALHALTPHAVVVHAHAVNAMTLSVLADGEARAAALLDGKLRSAWVGYHRPGAPLAAAVAEALAARAPDVLILQNHGVIVGGATPDEAEARLTALEALLALPARSFARHGSITASTAYEPLPSLAALALDPPILTALTASPLFPDQVVFLGGAVPVQLAGETLDQASARVHGATGVVPALILAPGVGAYGLIGRSAAADSVIEGLYEVARRLPPGAEVVGLPPEAAPELLGWDAEKYRQGLALGRSV